MRRRLFGLGLAIVIAVGLGGCIRSGMLMSKIEKEYPPIGRFVDIGGKPQHVFEIGEGAPVVFIHGASANIREFTSTLSPYLEDKPVKQILMDRPGLGYSKRVKDADRLSVQAQTAHSIVETITNEPVILVGHSYGGAVSMRYALDYPDDVKAVVMLSPVTHDWGKGGMTWYNQLAGTPVLGDVFSQIAPLVGPDAARSGLEALFFPAPVPETYPEDAGINLIFRPSSFKHNARDVLALKAQLAEQQKRYPTELTVPVYVFSGVYDTVLKPPLHSLRLRKEVDGLITVYDLSDEGHMPHHGKAEEIANLILELSASESGQIANPD